MDSPVHRTFDSPSRNSSQAHVDDRKPAARLADQQLRRWPHKVLSAQVERPMSFWIAPVIDAKIESQGVA
jgi:hypothetical protein